MRDCLCRSRTLAAPLAFVMVAALLWPSEMASQSGVRLSGVTPSSTAPAPSASISGRVVNASSGEPLAKVELRLVGGRPSAQSSSGMYSIRTSADGAFRLEGLRGGQYILSASRRAFAASAAELRGFASVRRAGPGWLLTLADGQAVRNAEIRLPPAAVVTGQLVDEDGEPMAGIVVEAEQYRYLQGVRTLAATGRATSDDRGIYRIYDLAPGRYFIKTRSSSQRARPGGMYAAGAPSPAASGVLFSRGGRGQFSGGGQGSNAEESFVYPDTYYPKAHSVSEAIPLQLAPGTEMGGIDFALAQSPTYSISGTVSGIETPPAAGEIARSTVFVSALQAGQFAFAAPAGMAPANPSTGEFTIRDLPSGNYQLIARSNPRGRENANSIGVAAVTIANSSAAGVSIPIVSDVTVPGRVAMPDDALNSSPGRIVITQIRRLSSARSSTRVGAQGAFEISLTRAEPLRFEIANIPEGLYVKKVTIGSTDVLHNPSDFLTSTPGPMVIELAADGASLGGTLRDGQGSGIANVRLSLIPASSFGREEALAASLWRRTAVTADDGSFAISGIAPGRYRLYAFETLDADPAFDVAFLSNFGQRWKEVHLKSGERATTEISPIPASETAMYLDEAP